MKKLLLLTIISCVLSACSIGGDQEEIPLISTPSSPVVLSATAPLGIDRSMIIGVELDSGSLNIPMTLMHTGSNYLFLRAVGPSAVVCTDLGGDDQCRSRSGEELSSSDTKEQLGIASKAVSRVIGREYAPFMSSTGLPVDRGSNFHNADLIHREMLPYVRDSDVLLSHCIRTENGDEVQVLCYADEYMPYYSYGITSSGITVTTTSSAYVVQEASLSTSDLQAVYDAFLES